VEVIYLQALRIKNMQILIDAYKHDKKLHHAYLIEGDRRVVFPKLSQFFKDEMGILCEKNNPDFWYGEFEKFGIDDSRQIKEMQIQRALTEQPRIFIIAAHFFTKEAQNTLLKVFEEPAKNVHFFLIITSSEKILPTLRSRFFLVPNTNLLTVSQKQELISNASAFLNGNIAERNKIIQPLIENKDKVNTLLLLDQFEIILNMREKNEKLQSYQNFFNDIVKCRSYLYNNAPSIKMILEHLVLSAPKSGIT